MSHQFLQLLEQLYELLNRNYMLFMEKTPIQF